jgi:hypothetical protein
MRNADGVDADQSPTSRDMTAAFSVAPNVDKWKPRLSKSCRAMIDVGYFPPNTASRDD